MGQPTHGVFPTLTMGYDSVQQFATSRLPKLSLPTFFSDPLTWQTFWDSLLLMLIPTSVEYKVQHSRHAAG